MLKTETSKTSRTHAGVAGVAITGFALPVMVGLSLTFVGPAAADVTNKQSFTAAQAQSAASNVMSFRGSTTPPIGKSRIRPALVGSATARSDAVPKAGAVAAFAAAPPQTVSAAARPTEQPKLGTALLAANRATAADASRPAEQVQAAMAARPAAAGNEALLHPVTIAALKNNAALAPAATSSTGAAPAAMAVVPAAAHAPASGAARTAMLKPASSMAADHSAATELLKSKAAVNALHKARQDAAAHQR
jgi:hypothetical protein